MWLDLKIKTKQKQDKENKRMATREKGDGGKVKKVKGNKRYEL